MLPLAAAVTAQNKRGLQTCVSSKFYVAVPVADHPTFAEVDVKILCCTRDYTRFRLATVAIETVGQLTHRWMVCAVVNPIQFRSVAFEVCGHRRVDSLNHILGKVSTGYACLVSNENGEPAIFV